MRYLLIILSLFFFSCDLFDEKGSCASYELIYLNNIPADTYDCWDNIIEEACYDYYNGDYWFSNQTCEEFCDDKLFCTIEN